MAAEYPDLARTRRQRHATDSVTYESRAGFVASPRHSYDDPVLPPSSRALVPPSRSSSSSSSRLPSSRSPSSRSSSQPSPPSRSSSPRRLSPRTLSSRSSSPSSAARGEAIEALTRDVLIRRSIEVSATGFITIIGIIQGVALALLAQNTFAKPGLLVCAQSIALLLLFVCVFYWYLTQSILLRWAPSFLDSLLPFAIAGLEIPAAFFLGNARAWNFWLAAFWSGILIGFWVTDKCSPPSHFGEAADAHRTLHVLIRELQMTAGVSALALALCGLFALLDPAHQLFWGLSGVAVVLTTVATLVVRTELGISTVHECFGVNRPPFN